MDIQELLDSVALADIRCIERVGKLELDGETGLAGWDEASSPGSLDLQVNPVSWGTRIEAWFRLGVDHAGAEVRAAYAVVYERDDDRPIPREVRKDFLERVAIMACLPYLREAIQHIAADLRLGNLVLPIVRLGEIQIDLAEAGIEPAEGDPAEQSEASRESQP